MAAKVKARFIEPMLLLRTDRCRTMPAVGVRAEARRLPGDRVQERRQASICARATTRTSASGTRRS